MKNELLKEYKKEREKIKRNRERYNISEGFQKYAERREIEIKAKEEIIKILCGIDGMTSAAAENTLDDVKKMISAVAMQQSLKLNTG